MPHRPFFRKHDRWWVAQLRQGAMRWQHKLIKGTLPKGTDTQQQACQLFNQLMAEGSDSLPPPTKIRMADVLKAFLEHSSTAHKPSTFAWYKNFLVSIEILPNDVRSIR